MSNYQTEELHAFANAFKALANPHRLQIFNILSSCCETGTECDALQHCVGDIASRVDVAPSTLSHHLKELQQAGLINMRRQGKQIFCSINPGMLKEIRILFKQYERNAKSATRAA